MMMALVAATTVSCHFNPCPFVPVALWALGSLNGVRGGLARTEKEIHALATFLVRNSEVL